MNKQANKVVLLVAIVLLTSTSAKSIYVEKEGDNKKTITSAISESYIGIHPLLFLSSSYYTPTNEKITSIGIAGVCFNISLYNYNIQYSFISHGDYLGESGSTSSKYYTHNASIGYSISLFENIGLRPNIGYYRYNIPKYNDIKNSIFIGLDTMLYLDSDGFYSISPTVGYNGIAYTYGLGVSATVYSTDNITIGSNIEYKYNNIFSMFTFSTSIGISLHFLD